MFVLVVSQFSFCWTHIYLDRHLLGMPKKIILAVDKIFHFLGIITSVLVLVHVTLFSFIFIYPSHYIRVYGYQYKIPVFLRYCNEILMIIPISFQINVSFDIQIFKPIYYPDRYFFSGTRFRNIFLE